MSFGKKIDLGCKICSHVFSTQGNLRKHLKNVHDVEAINIVPYSFDKFHNKCLEGCNTSYRFTKELRNHLKMSHSMEIEKEILLFSTREEFEIWYNDLCDTGNLGYVRREFTDKNKIYYLCNRSGRIEVKSDNRKRALKSKGSCKMGHNCISQISLTPRKDNIYVATYYKTHYGHETEVEHVRLPKKKRVDIAAKLSNGVPKTKILDMYRNNSFKDKLLRTNLITRKDIDNIRTSYKIKTPDSAGSEHDSSIDHSEEQPTGIGDEEQNDSETLQMEEVCLIIVKDDGDNEESKTLITENSLYCRSVPETDSKTSVVPETEKSVCADVILDRDEIIAELNEIQLKVTLASNEHLEPILPQIKKKLKNINNLLSSNDPSKLLSHKAGPSSAGEPAEKEIRNDDDYPPAKSKAETIKQITTKPSMSEIDSIRQNMIIIRDHEY